MVRRLQTTLHQFDLKSLNFFFVSFFRMSFAIFIPASLHPLPSPSLRPMETPNCIFSSWEALLQETEMDAQVPGTSAGGQVSFPLTKQMVQVLELRKKKKKKKTKQRKTHNKLWWVSNYKGEECTHFRIIVLSSAIAKLYHESLVKAIRNMCGPNKYT